MLAIRMQRTGRKGHAQFRVVVQDSRFSPTSGRVVAYLGSYNPHTKTTTLNKQKAESYLSNGAQPSERVASLLKSEGLKLPSWVKAPSKHERSIRNPEKLRRNRPAEPEVEAPAEEPAAETEPDTPAEETVEDTGEAETVAEESAPAEPEVEAPAEEASADETPVEEPAAETEPDTAES
jgi:small subunit ribosomal protein S16